MTRTQALELANKGNLPVVVPNEWGRFDYALPGGITACRDQKIEVLTDLAERGYDSYLIVQPETLCHYTVYDTPLMVPA
jgi:hypothetical protein